MTPARFDDSNIRWNTLEGIDDLWYHMLNVDESNRIVDILFKFSANAKVILHRHWTNYSTFIVQGELRLYNARNELVEIRKTEAMSRKLPTASRTARAAATRMSSPSSATAMSTARSMRSSTTN